MNIIEYTINDLKKEVKRLEHDYKQTLKDPSYRTVYPYSESGISHTLETIIYRSFELKVCNMCEKFHECDQMLRCIRSIDGAAVEAKEFGDRCCTSLGD